MNKKFKYYFLFPALVVSAAVISILLIYNVYNIFSYRVYLIAPETKILVSTEFTSTILIKGSKSPTLIEVYLDDLLTEKKMFKDYNVTNLGELKIINLRIDPLYLASGTHRMSIVLKGGFFQKDSRIESEFIYERLNNNFALTNPDAIAKMKGFFAEDVSQLIVKLNNARDYYINSDWKKSDKYISQKELVANADVDANIKNKVLTLINLIENKSSLDEIDNSVNSLNLELYNKGYPLTNLMFENRYQNGTTNSFLLSYEVIDSVLLTNINQKSIVHILKRIDGINITEQFLGIKLPNSPFSYIINDKFEILKKRYANILGNDFQSASFEIKKLSDKYLDSENEIKELQNKFKEEANYSLKRNSLDELLKYSNAYHEIRHLNDYKEARKIGTNVPEILKYFYGDFSGKFGFSIDSSYAQEKQITQTLLKANPEYSAYLYELTHSDGLRRILLLSLFEKIINPDKEETSHHWAAKLIIYNLAKMNNLTSDNLLIMQVQGNESNWYKLTKQLIDLPFDKIEKDAARLMVEEFG